MLPVHVDRRLGLLEGARKRDADVGVPGLAGAVHHASHDRHREFLHPRVALAPDRELGPEVALDVLGHFLEEGGGRPAAPGAGGDLGLEAPDAQRLEDLLPHLHLERPVPSGLRGERDADRVADPLDQEGREPRRGGHDPLGPHPRLGEPQMKGVAAVLPVQARGQLPVDGDQLRHLRDLGRNEDLVGPEAGLLGQLGRADGALHDGIPEHGRRLLRYGKTGVPVHELREEILVQRAPVHPDPDRLVVVHGDGDDLLEVLVPPLRAHVAGIDPVLGQRPGALGVVPKEEMPVVVEVPDEGCGDPLVPEACHDLGNRLCRIVVVHRDPNHLAPGGGERPHLGHRPFHVRRVRVGHGLDHHRVVAPHLHATDVRRHGPSTLPVAHAVLQLRNGMCLGRTPWEASVGGLRGGPLQRPPRGILREAPANPRVEST